MFGWMITTGCVSRTIRKPLRISREKMSTRKKRWPTPSAWKTNFSRKSRPDSSKQICQFPIDGTIISTIRGTRRREYPICARKRGSLDQPEEILLNGNVLAEGHEFFSIGGWAVSSGQDLLAYAVDTQGRRIYT